MEINIRVAEEIEASSILDLDKNNFSNFFDEKFYIEKILEENLLVAVIDKKIVGFILFNSVFDEAEIYKIVVSKDFRKNGISKELMKNFIERVKKKDILKIFLEVRESNIPAIKLYENFGFENIRIISDYYSNPKENGIVMLKEVIDERY